MKTKIIYLFVLFLSVQIFSQIISPGSEFVKERKYYSPNASYYLTFQRDGNLVMYSKENRPLWDSKTANRGVRAVFQNDGNLVVYNNQSASIFTTNTYNKGDLLKIQNDGNLVIYGAKGALWASKDQKGNQDAYYKGFINKGKNFRTGEKNYSANGEYYLVFQVDGNLVLYYRSDRNPIWSTNTQGRGVKAAFQSDGNLVVYDKSNNAVFATNRTDRNIDKLTVQDDGNLVVYTYDDQVVWAAKY